MEKREIGILLNKLGMKNPSKQDVSDFEDLVNIGEAMEKLGYVKKSSILFAIENNSPRYDRFKKIIEEGEY